MDATTSPSSSQQEADDDCAADCRIFTFLAGLGVLSVHYERHTKRLICTRRRRNWTLLCVVLYSGAALYLFFNFQIDNFISAVRLLPGLTDTVRVISIAYAYQSLICVACCYRQRYAAYFNALRDLDDTIARSALAVRPDCRRARSEFWLHTGLWWFNHLLVVLPFELHHHAGQPLHVAVFELADAATAIGIGMTTFYLEFSVHSCRERYACLRDCLRKALGTDDEGSVVADGGESGSCADVVRASIRLMSDVDAVKERLNDDFGVLIAWKLLIDGVSIIASLHFSIYNLLNHGQLTEQMHSAASFVLFDLPYVVANVLMVHQCEALANVVSE